MGKPYKTNLMLSLGLISTSVDLETVIPKSTSGLSRICPDHSVKLNQKYQCKGTDEVEAHDVTWGEWNMGRETAEGWTVVDQETRPTVEGSKGFSLVPVPVKDLESATIEGDSVYYASPSNEHAEQSWAVFNAVVKKGKVALITKGALRKGTFTEKIWRLTSFNGYLVFREVKFPENIKPSPEVPKVKLDKVQLGMVQQIVDAMTTEWTEFDASDNMSARMAQWMEDGTDVEAQEAKAAPALDLNAALAAALNDKE
jgi:non-homologous end joining protein Ku